MLENQLDELERSNLGAKLAVSTVLTLDSRVVTLREHWSAAPSLTCFLRHYGCLFCHQMAHDIAAVLPEVRDAGAQVILIGNGSTEQARVFFEHMGLAQPGCVLLTDPERGTYDTAGLRRSFAATFLHPGAWRAYGGARSEGHRITGVGGTVTQLGALMITRPPAFLELVRRSEFAGDHPPMADILDAVRAVCRRAAAATG